MKPTPIRTKRSGSYNAFARRYNPLPSGSRADGTILHDDFRNMPVEHLRALEENRLWTVVDEDNVLYLCPGRRFVNRFGYVITEHPYDEQEEKNTPYVY